MHNNKNLTKWLEFRHLELQYEFRHSELEIELTDHCCSETESVTAQICSGRNRTEPHMQTRATFALRRTRGFNEMRVSDSVFPYTSQCPPLH